MQIHAFLMTAMDSVRRRKPRRPLHTRTWLQRTALPFLLQESNSDSSVVQTVYWSLKNKRAIRNFAHSRYCSYRLAAWYPRRAVAANSPTTCGAPYRFVYSFRAGPGWNCSNILVLLESCLQTCMTYNTAESTVNKLLTMGRETVRNM
jgi:hypothetical protein